MCTHSPFIALIALALTGCTTAGQPATAPHSEPHPIHLFTFEGEDDAARLADSAGDVRLQRLPGEQSGDVAAIAFEPGFGGVGQAVRPAYVADAYETGAALGATGGFDRPDRLTVEAVVQVGEPRSERFNHYIVCSRGERTERGYYLVQKIGNHFSSTIGEVYEDRPEILSDFVPGDWYYLAATFVFDDAGNTTTMTGYAANLTRGEADLRPVTHTFAGVAGDTHLGVGALNIDGSIMQGFFNGLIDSIAFYDTILTEQQLESHAAALLKGVDQR